MGTVKNIHSHKRPIAVKLPYSSWRSINKKRRFLMPAPSLEYFIEVAKHKNISKAARSLHISQQALSSYIQRLESYYGVTLLERKPTLELTKAGQIVLLAAESIEKIQDSLIDDLSAISMNTHVQQRLSIGIYRPNASLLMQFIPLVEFNKAYPLISYTITEESNHLLWNMLRERKLDLVISSYKPGTVFPDFEEKVLYNDNEHVFISSSLLKQYFPDTYPDCINRFAKGVKLSEFHKIPVLMYPVDSGSRAVVEQYFKDNRLSYNVVGECPDRFLINTIVRNSMAYSFCDRWFLSRLQKSASPDVQGTVYAFPIIEPMLKRTVGLLYRKEDNLPSYFKELVQMITNNKQFKKNASSFDYSQPLY